MVKNLTDCVVDPFFSIESQETALGSLPKCKNNFKFS